MKVNSLNGSKIYTCTIPVYTIPLLHPSVHLPHLLSILGVWYEVLD